MNEKMTDGREPSGENVRTEALSPATLKAMGEQVAEITFSDEEAAAYAPLLDGFAKIIRGIEMREEIEPAVVFQAGQAEKEI